MRLQVEELGAVERDQVLCVSSQKKFQRPKESQHFTELKANWARMYKRQGVRSVDCNSLLFNRASNSAAE